MAKVVSMSCSGDKVANLAEAEVTSLDHRFLTVCFRADGQVHVAGDVQVYVAAVTGHVVYEGSLTSLTVDTLTGNCWLMIHRQYREDCHRWGKFEPNVRVKPRKSLEKFGPLSEVPY